MRLSSLLLLTALMPAFAFAQESAPEAAPAATETAPLPVSVPKKPLKSGRSVTDYVVLNVDGTEIHRSEVVALWKGLFAGQGQEAPDFDSQDPKIKQNVLSGLASEIVVLNQAKKDGLEEDEAVLKKFELAKRQLLIQEYVSRKLAPQMNEAALHEYYEKQMSKLGKQQEVRVRHILVKTPEEAKRAYERIQGGEDFAKVASDMSIEKSSGAQGGEVGWVGKGYAVPEFVNAALPLKDGEVSKPVKTAFGWHLIQAEEHRTRTPAPFEESKPQVAQQAQNAAMQDLVQNLLQKSDIKYFSQSGERLPFNRKLPDNGAANPAPAAR